MSVTKDVENLLRDYSVCRDSDKALLVYYLQSKGMNLTKEQMLLFKKLPSMETIRRTRQVLQERGKYPASPKVEEARYEKYKEMRYNIQQDDPEKILESKGYVIREWGQ